VVRRIEGLGCLREGVFTGVSGSEPPLLSTEHIGKGQEGQQSRPLRGGRSDPLYGLFHPTLNWMIFRRSSTIASRIWSAMDSTS
jgi:hypothetical protein